MEELNDFKDILENDSYIYSGRFNIFISPKVIEITLIDKREYYFLSKRK